MNMATFPEQNPSRGPGPQAWRIRREKFGEISESERWGRQGSVAVKPEKEVGQATCACCFFFVFPFFSVLVFLFSFWGGGVDTGVDMPGWKNHEGRQQGTAGTAFLLWGDPILTSFSFRAKGLNA